MKKILFITAFPPNQQTAGQNYTRNLLDDLVKFAIIDIVFFNYKDHSIQIDPKIKITLKFSETTFSKIINSIKIPFLHPFFTCRFHLRILYYLMFNAQKYDILYFDFSQVFIYSYFIKHHCKIFMAHDIISQKYQRKKNVFTKLTYSLLERTERILFKSSSEIYCFSLKDKILIQEKYGLKSNIVSFYLDKAITQLDLESIRISDYFVFFGAWNRPENEKGLVWFFEFVYPHIQDKRIKIIGPKLSDNINEMLSNFNNIEYLGFVNNPYLHIAKSQGLIAPLFEGAGVKVKVIESLATGTPIIGTKIALEGININNLDKYIHIAGNASDFINILRNYRYISVENKLEINQNFLQNYNHKKFLRYL